MDLLVAIPPALADGLVVLAFLLVNLAALQLRQDS